MRKILFVLLLALISQSTLNFVSAKTEIVSKPLILPKHDPDPAKVKAALKEFKNLSAHEKKMRLKEVKQQIREYKKQKREGKDEASKVSTFLLVIIAILLPPLAVYLHDDAINSHFWIDLILTLLLWLPGLIYALVIVLSKD